MILDRLQLKQLLVAQPDNYQEALLRCLLLPLIMATHFDNVAAGFHIAPAAAAVFARVEENPVTGWASTASEILLRSAKRGRKILHWLSYKPDASVTLKVRAEIEDSKKRIVLAAAILYADRAERE